MQRIKSIDLSRGFTVLFIPIVHSVMLYSQPSLHESGFGKTLAFVAEWPGAQVFMLLMGVSFAITKQNNFKRVLMRSIVLLLFGYLLNALKFLLPYFTVGLPKAFLSDTGTHDWQSFLLVGDIFHFAALSLIVLFILKRSPEYPVVSILLTVVICFASPYLWNKHSDNAFINHLLQLISGQPPNVYFPFFPWVVYPIAGLAIGYFIKRDIVKTHIVLFFLGITLFLISTSIVRSNEKEAASFYRTAPWDTMQHLGFVLSWVSIWYWAAEFIPDNFLFRFLTWCSKRITLIYVIQWPLIFWLLPTIGYQQLNLMWSIVVSITVAVVVFGIASYLTTKPKELAKQKIHDSSLNRLGSE